MPKSITKSPIRRIKLIQIKIEKTCKHALPLTIRKYLYLNVYVDYGQKSVYRPLTAPVSCLLWLSNYHSLTLVASYTKHYLNSARDHFIHNIHQSVILVIQSPIIFITITMFHFESAQIVRKWESKNMHCDRSLQRAYNNIFLFYWPIISNNRSHHERNQSHAILLCDMRCDLPQPICATSI